MQYSAIVFDLDGTLVDTIGLWIEAYFDTLQSIGASMSREEFLENIYYVNAYFDDVLHGLGIEKDQWNAIHQQRDQMYIELLQTKAKWFPGAKECLEECDKKYPVALVTGSWMRYVDAIDTKLDIKKYFKQIVTCDDTQTRSKPHPYPLELIAEKLQLKPSECLKIGDQLFDVESAKAAGMDFVLIPREFTPPKALQEAETILEDIGDVLRII